MCYENGMLLAGPADSPWVELPLPPGEEWSAELVCVYDGGVVAVSAHGAVVGWPSFPQWTVGACHGRAAIGSEDRVRSAVSLQAVRVVGDSVR